MITSIPGVLLLSLVAGIMADYSSSDQAYYNNYPYQQDYSNYTYNIPQTSAVASGRKRRVFTTDNPMTFSVTFEFDLPLPDLNSEISVEVPFSFDLPTAVSTKRSLVSGRSLSGSSSVRSELYKKIEGLVGTVTGGYGQPCLLRAMCEVGSNPFHDDGIIGDVMTFLLSSNFADEEEDERFQTYLEAQTNGKIAGDCSAFHKECPMSFFNLIHDNEL